MPFDVDSQKWGSFSKNAILNSNLQISCQICKFLQMRAKRAKILNLYVKFDAKVEKKGYWAWTGKKGVIGFKIGVKRGSIDKHLISIDIWECPQGSLKTIETNEGH